MIYLLNSLIHFLITKHTHSFLILSTFTEHVPCCLSPGVQTDGFHPPWSRTSRERKAPGEEETEKPPARGTRSGGVRPERGREAARPPAQGGAGPGARRGPREGPAAEQGPQVCRWRGRPSRGRGGGRGLVICRTCDVCHQHCLFLAPSIYARRSPWQLTDLESVHRLARSFPAHSPSTLSSALEKMSPCRFSATHWYMPASARPTAVMFSVPCSI